jgi:hypothetical protein
VLSADELNVRAQEIASARDLGALLKRLEERARPLLQGTLPDLPPKALLTSDGGVCPEEGSRLDFDPWNPREHRCRRCGNVYRGERHDRAWAHYQHLWLAERAAHLAALAVFGAHDRAAVAANRVLQSYRRYPEYPNRDNVLGPSRLFFSTYLESIWITNYLAAAMLLRESGLLDETSTDVVAVVADEAATIIGDFDEGLSNRQTWHNAALAAIAVWFEDEELATRAIESSSGMLIHLLQGFGSDGMWYEGDNYHLFALRGQLVAMGWARQAGVDLLADARLQLQLAAALRAPALTALPDLTFPARKDSRFGVSLAQPMYLELWEIGLARLSAAEAAPPELWTWLRDLYQVPAPSAQTFDSYLHEAGDPEPPATRNRAELSWWSLLEMAPALPEATPPWLPVSSFIESQGLAVLRDADRYVSVECGIHGGGHGHPDRLNLTLHADGQHWLPDFGTGSYVSRDLFWYRSTLAHNAPRLDGVSQPAGDAVCDNFDQQDGWAWVRGRFGELTRTVVAGPHYVLDILELFAADSHVLELPLHLTGKFELEGPGAWVGSEVLSEEFVEQPELFVPPSSGPRVLRSSGNQAATLAVHLLFDGDFLRARAPGAPTTPGLVPFYLLRGQGRSARMVCLLESTQGKPTVRSIRSLGTTLEVETASGIEQHLPTADGWEIRSGGATVRLGGLRRHPAPFKPLVQADRPGMARGVALLVREAPVLEGTLEGFDIRAPLDLDHEDQYRRSEEPYAGPEEFAARAYINWSDEGLYLAVEVTKPDVFPRNPDAPPLKLDNEPEEIHGDGIQVYLRLPEEEAVHGLLIVPSAEGKALIVRPASGMAGSEDSVSGSWQATDTGYTITLQLRPKGWTHYRPQQELGFDLLINQMLPDRQRRAGQLVWSGGGGWVWLRGDRQDPARLGVLELSNT